MSEDKFNLTRLIKLLKMTTSTVDAEALVAMRLANQEIVKLGTDWEGILKGRITIVADPFDSIPEPPRSRQTTPPTPPARPQPAPTFKRGYPPTPSSRPPRAPPPNPFTTSPPPPQSAQPPMQNPTTVAADWIRQHKRGRLNAYKAHCHVCGTRVYSQEGFLVDTGNGWKVECFNDFTARQAAQQSTPKSKGGSTVKPKTIDPKDLANILS